MTDLIASVKAVKEAIKNLIGEDLYKDEGQIDICEIGPEVYSVYEKLFNARAELEALIKEELHLQAAVSDAAINIAKGVSYDTATAIAADKFNVRLCDIQNRVERQ